MLGLPVLTLVTRLIVETGSPDALCPDLASAEAAIGSRLGELELGGSGPWRVRYTIGHAPAATSGDFVRLTLYDPQNELRLSRDLPLAGESCATVARVIAVVIDRFFRALVAGEEGATAEGPEQSGAVPSAAIDAGSPEGGGPEPPSPATPPASTLTARVGVVSAPVSPTLGLAFTRRTPRGFSLSVELTWIVAPATDELDAGARAESRSALLRLSPAWDIGLGSAELALGPTLALGVERGATTGLPTRDVKYRAVAAAGALACLRLALDEGLSVEILGGAEAPFRPFGGDFVVDAQRVLEPVEVRGFMAVGVGSAW